ncbi:ABC transporter permease [Vagococcus entomophilus]|uniref:Transport permease protein n=1 Tax=Vagococcus entomophilus TaxID=1160095 RepID=A0A430AHV4_9ENTE|nr:ABC transporter permease [Vagococcus entomophilus]RSU07689.1 hypothetical protein CBF30_00160 [Vagococcus entomophilus]
MNKTLVQLKMEFKRAFLRNKSFIFFSLCMPIGFYLLFTKVLNMGVTKEQMPAFNMRTLQSMTIYSVLISSIYSLSGSIVTDKIKGVTQLMITTPFSTKRYLGIKLGMQMLLNSLLICLIFIVGIVVNKVQAPILTWLSLGGWILYGTLPFMAIALLISFAKRAETVSILGNIFVFPLAIVSGLWWPIEYLPKMIQAIAKFLPTYYVNTQTQSILKSKAPTVQSFLIIFVYFVGFVLLYMYIKKKKGQLNHA